MNNDMMASQGPRVATVVLFVLRHQTLKALAMNNGSAMKVCYYVMNTKSAAVTMLRAGGTSCFRTAAIDAK